jgi:hypothetical protein
MSSLDFWRNEAAVSPFPQEVSSLKLLELKALILSSIVGATLCAILFESVPLYILLITLLGLPIRWAEAQVNQPYICAFGTLFWGGHILTRVVAALARTWLSTSQLSPLVLRGTLIGMTAFAFAYVATMVRPQFSGKRWRNPEEIKINWSGASIACGIIALVSTILIPLVGGRGRGLVSDFGPVFNIVGGIKRSVYLLPAVLLGLSMYTRTQQHTVLIGISWLSIFLGDVLESGRNLFFKSILVAVFAWTIFQPDLRKVRRHIVILGLIGILVMMILGAYRGEFSPYLSTSSRARRLWQTVTEFRFSTKYLRRQTLMVADRFYQPVSVELTELSKDTGIQGGGYALDQLVYVYVPKFLFPQKGSGRGKDLLFELGLIPYYSEVNGIPVVLVTDAYYRWRNIGIVGVYVLTGIVLSSLARWVWRMENAVLASVLLSIIGYRAFRACFLDVYRLSIWWIYDIPKLLILSILVLVAVGAFDTSKLFNWLKGYHQAGSEGRKLR